MNINENNINNQPYQTSDLYACTCLICKGFHLEKIVPEEGNSRRFIFIFKNERNKEIRNVADSFYNGEVKVSARDFVHAIRDLKSYINQNRN